MESLLALLALVPIALVILMIVLINRISGLSRDLRDTREQLGELLDLSARQRVAANPPTEAPPETPHDIAPPSVVEPPIPPREEEVTVARMRELFPDTLPDRSVEVTARGPDPGTEHPPRPAVVVVEAPSMGPQQPPRAPSPSFFERHPDLEKFIGENLINKVGITVLVIGIGLLLRYAIGKGLISESGRTLIGLLAGGVLVFLAHRLRASFRAFSSVLVAGGIAVFYSTIAIAFHQYQLIGQAAAFVVMVAITALAVMLTLAYDRKELAVISLLGGFAAPFLVSTGEGNFKVLFTYLLILDAGMLVLANYKKWHIINILSFALTLIIFGAWAMGPYVRLEPRPSLFAFAFATAFFLVFFGMNLRYNLSHKQGFTPLDHALLLLNTAAFYAAGMHLLSDLTIRVTGLFTALLGLFYLVFALYFHRREGIPRPLKLLLIGLVLTFISLAAPVQLEGSYITLFWAAEAVLLLWFAHRTQLGLVERASALVSLLMLLSLWMDLSTIYGWSADATMRPLLNKGWNTGMVAACSLGAMTILLRRSDRSAEVLPGFTRSIWSLFTTVLGVGVLYVVNFLELRHQLGRMMHPSVVDLALMAYSLLFVLVLEFASRKATTGFRIALSGLFILCGIQYVSGFRTSSRNALWQILGGDGGPGFIPFHAVAFILMVIMVVRMAGLARKLLQRPSTGWTIYLWSMSVFLVVFASQELDLGMLLAQHPEGDPYTALTEARRVGYPILWGIGSFLFMWYGMRQRMRMMRIVALVLFGITLLKLFLFDLGSLSEGGRVAAFIFLGVLLLVISFMYQKLKGLLLEDGPRNTAADDAPLA